MRIAEIGGYWFVMLISIASLPIRAVVAASFITTWGVFPVQILDSVGLGCRASPFPAWWPTF